MNKTLIILFIGFFTLVTATSVYASQYVHPNMVNRLARNVESPQDLYILMQKYTYDNNENSIHYTMPLSMFLATKRGQCDEFANLIQSVAEYKGWEAKVVVVDWGWKQLHTLNRIEYNKTTLIIEPTSGSIYANNPIGPGETIYEYNSSTWRKP